MSSVPLELPGTIVPRGSEQDAWLKGHVASLCGLEHDRCVTQSDFGYILRHAHLSLSLEHSLFLIDFREVSQSVLEQEI